MEQPVTESTVQENTARRLSGEVDKLGILADRLVGAVPPNEAKPGIATTAGLAGELDAVLARVRQETERLEEITDRIGKGFERFLV